MDKSQMNILLSSNEYRLKRRYWTEKLLQMESHTLLKQYGYYPEGIDTEYATARIACSSELSQRVKQVSNGKPLSTYILFLAALKILIHRYTGEQQITVLSPMYQECEKELCFNSLIPLYDSIHGAMEYKEILFQLKKTAMETYQNQCYPMERILEQLNDESKQEVTMLSNIACRMSGIHDEQVQFCDYNFFMEEEEGRYSISLKYHTTVCNTFFAEQLLQHLSKIMTVCLNQPATRVGDINLLSEQEIDTWIHSYNHDVSISSKTIVQQFELQVEMTPDSVAICDQIRSMTYRELNQCMNRLGHYLIEAGVQRQSTVGVIMDNSIEAVIAFFAVLKVGAIYLPISRTLPLNRTEYMLEQSEVHLILTDEPMDDPQRKIVQIKDDMAQIKDYPSTNLDIQISSDECAYMIFTSGSTGKPKGAMIRHRGLYNYVMWAKKVYQVNENSSFPFYSSISFDLTVTSIYTPLVSGGRIVIYDGADKATLVKKIIEDGRVDILKLTPAHLAIIEELDCTKCNIKKFIVGGENLKAELTARIVQRFQGNVEVYNEYGPTEATVGCMIYRYDKENDLVGSVPIGVPAQNTRIYLLDSYKKLVPYGVLGELYIAGAGIAKGYLNQPDVTEKVFLQDSMYEKIDMYKTGDYAFMRKNNQMEYIGRKDKQVKVKGFRIELGEIESNLLQISGIKNCVVMLCKQERKDDQLVAYIVLHKQMTAEEIKQKLQKNLPYYMIPSHIYQVDSIPMNYNGKVDFEALDYKKQDLDVKNEYVAPRNQWEELLVSIYEEVLGIQSVGVLDDFFMLGGDSIKAIRVAASLFKKNYQIGIEDIFAHPQIETLSQYLRSIQTTEEVCEGEVPLTPIQQYFFQQNYKQPNHYYQSMVLHAKEGFDEKTIKEAIHTLVQYHDCFRLRFYTDKEEKKQIYMEPGDEYYFHTREVSFEKLSQQISDIQNELVQALDIENGPLISCELAKTEQGDHLLVVIHHLIVDGVSWRIFIEDLDEIYSKLKNKESLNLPKKTSSYQTWSRWVYEYANQDARIQEFNYWQGKLRTVPCLLEVRKENKIEYEKIRFHLSLEQSRALQADVHLALGTNIHSFLITAFAMALKQILQKETVAFLVESHGREKVGEQINISRTMGWFTSIYPVVLSLEHCETGEKALQMVRDSLSQIPNKGFDYSVLKYCSKKWKNSSSELQKSFDILFNYLGDISNEVKKENFEQSILKIEGNMDSDERSPYLIEVNGVCNHNIVEFSVRYRKWGICDETIPQRLMEAFQQNIIALIELCQKISQKKENYITVSDRTMTLDELSLIESAVADIDLGEDMDEL